MTGQPGTQVTRRTPNDDKAHDLYLKGRFAWQRWTAEGAQKGIDLFKAALEVDPEYPLAYSVWRGDETKSDRSPTWMYARLRP